MKKIVLRLCAQVVALAWSTSALTISTDTSEYLIGMPIYLRIRDDTSECSHITLEMGAFKLQCVSADTAMTYPGAGWVDGPCYPPGEVGYSVLIASLNGLFPPKPGSYKFFLQDRNAIVSNYLEVRIKPPSSGPDKDAFAEIGKAPDAYARAIYANGEYASVKAVPILQNLSAHPNAYREMAQAILSNYYSLDYPDYESKTPGKPVYDPGKARAFAQVANSRLPMYLRMKNAEFLDDAAIKHGEQWPELDAAIDGLLATIPEEWSREYRRLQASERQKFRAGHARLKKNQEWIDAHQAEIRKSNEEQEKAARSQRKDPYTRP